MTKIEMTDRIGDLTPEQIDHLAKGLELAHGMTIKDANGGRYWFGQVDGGAILMTPDRTVGHIWRCAELISAEMDARPPDNKVLPPR